MNIADSLERTARALPNEPAILFEGRSLSYAELDRAASRVASVLESWQLGRGDRIALYLPNLPEFASVCLGAQKRGIVVVALSSMLKAAELAFALRDCGARALFTTASLLPELRPVQGDLPALEHVVMCEGEAPAGDALELTQLLASSPGELRALDLPSDAPAAILYTSGTTGAPKGAVLTHGNLRVNTANTTLCVGSQPGDRHLLFLPLSHCFGQNFVMHSTFASGGTLVLQRRYQLQQVIADVERCGITHFYGVPTNYIYLLEAQVQRAQLQTVRLFFSAAATMPREVAQAWQDRFGRAVHEGYGLTETAPLATYNHREQYRLGSVGTPVPGVELQVIDEAGRPCAIGESGELCIKGPNVMAGYFGRERETHEAIVDGWFHTGDIGHRDADGYYYLVDRVKDMINCAGYKVWPREVEEVLYRHASVAECAVVGQRDATKGERVVAYVRVKPGTAEPAAIEPSLRSHCEAQLARYKRPDSFVFDREIPKSPSGKILKRLLRD